MKTLSHGLAVFALVIVGSGLSSISVAQSKHPGLRDPIAIGISLGAPTALVADLQLKSWQSSAIALEGFYGAAISRWGIGESYGFGARADFVIGDDRVNDAWLLSPGIGLNTIVGEPTGRSWIDFAPYTTVQAIAGNLSVSYVHEYSSWSLRASLAPGVAYGLSGTDSGHDPAKGTLSFQLSAALKAQFGL